MFSFTELATADTKHLWLTISPAEQQRALQQSQSHSNPIACYNAYLNRVCLHSFISWLEEWLQEDSLPSPSVWLGEDSLASIWEVVNGVAIQVAQTRLVLVPSEIMDLEELRVPQEWVDISSWAADYYLALQVNLDDEDDCWVGVRGFATHRQLKNGTYNSGDRTYSLPIEQLTKSLTLLFATMGLHLQAEIPPLPTLSEPLAKKLLLTLGDASVYSPRLRLDVPFTQWAALISNEQWRQQLYNQRLGNLQSDIAVTITPSKTQVYLSHWFQKLFDAPWQPIDVFLGTQLGNLAFDIRSFSASGKAGVNGIRLIDLGMQLGEKSVALLLALTQEAEDKIGIIVQVHPTGSEKFLPPNLKLVVLESGNILQAVESRSRDYYIKLNRFKGLPGTSFSIQLILGNFSITEDFLI